ncbi:glycosyltransferase [Anaerorhabdus furcosa]|uniref:Glycosyltransferase involved in cell wall bisynthesis n=1 Tax=Anaerorhabdus furcosa TaxID=118967 RepID=A0A1T4LPN3_9FIRM|nr:glycosyltransferase [Anaerorhabdus furcosa]SJZ56586.1 Glycosyltransferase involved in cell wall bisynthesis [Anaerorhabdus furcosa]
MISVIVPIFHTEKYLQKCVNSILCQTYSDLEVILVDDGTTIYEANLCDDFAKRDARVKVIHKLNGGLSSARNVGLELARGDYVGFVDSDDYIHPLMYETLLKNMMGSNANISTCEVYKTYEKEEIKGSITNKIKVIHEKDMFYELSRDPLNMVIMCNKLYKKELFDNIKFPIDKYHEDEFVIHHLLYEAKSVVYTDAKLYFYLQNRENSIGNEFSEKKLQDAWNAFDNRCQFIKEINHQDYLRARVDQIWLTMNNYKRCKNNNSNNYLVYRKKFFNLIRDFKIWSKAGFFVSAGWCVFIICPSLYFCLIDYKNRN